VSFSRSFFEVSAQLIPVLFLAMVVEERLQPDAEEKAIERVMRSWLLTLLVVGEMIALAVVAGGVNPSKASGSVVACTLLFSVFLLAVPILEKELQHDRSRAERVAHAGAGLVVILAVLWIVLSIQFS
jgi:hypothetical protein